MKFNHITINVGGIAAAILCLVLLFEHDAILRYIGIAGIIFLSVQ